MNKLQKVLVLIVITLLVVVLWFVFVNPKSNLDVDNKPVINNDSSVNEEENLDNIELESVDNSEPVIEQSKQEAKQVEQSKENHKQEEKKSSSSSNKQTEVKPKVENKKEEPIVNKPVQEEKNNPWDLIGITENQYYHSPQFDWQKVTHKDLNSCQIEGNAKIDDESNSFTQFWCYEVISYSGNKLGYMLELS